MTESLMHVPDLLHVTFLKNLSGEDQVVRPLPWEGLSGVLRRVRSGEKEGFAWRPAIIEQGAGCENRVKAVSVLVLNVEGTKKRDSETGVATVIGPEPPGVCEMADRIEVLGFKYVLHTTFSHLAPEILPTGVPHPHYRLVFALSRPLKPDEVRPLGHHVASTLGISECFDRGGVEPDRLFYLPRAPASRVDLFEFREGKGEPLNVDALLSEARRAEKALQAATKIQGMDTRPLAWKPEPEPEGNLETAVLQDPETTDNGIQEQQGTECRNNRERSPGTMDDQTPKQRGASSTLTDTRKVEPKTEEAYTRDAERLRRRFKRETGQEPETDCRAFLAWMDTRYATVKPRTRRRYHAALTRYQAKHHPNCLPGPIPKGLPDRKAIQKEFGPRTTSGKAKSAPESVERSVMNMLRDAATKPRGSNYSIWAEYIFRAGLRFGLRPSEWKGSWFFNLDNGELALQVPNAKYSQGRTFGPTRTLIVDEQRLDALDPRALEAAFWLIDKTRLLKEEEYDLMIKRAGEQMRQILKRCGKPCRASGGNVTLYTARHQFAANAKSDGLTREEIAALMGHASIYTAGEHYGKRRSGRGRFGMHGNGTEGDQGKPEVTCVSPHIDDVRAVMKLEQERQERRRTKPKSGPAMG